jgi:hypothetical protein
MRSVIKLKSKKGEITDMLIWIVTLFSLAIGLLMLIYIIPSISNGLRLAGLNASSEGAAVISSMESIGTHTINNGFLLLFTGLIISLMITSFLVRTHPIFIFLYIFVLTITLLLAAYLGNAWQDMSTNPIFATTLQSAGFINYIMSHIVEFALGAGALSMIIMFSKFSSFGGGGPL